MRQKLFFGSVRVVSICQKNSRMLIRELFAEMPYGSALNEKNLTVRCSNCFSTGNAVRCNDGCQLVYCSEKCRDADRPSHQYECQVFRETGDYDIDQFVRLLARILTRRLFDNGIVNLCENFPTTVLDRRLADLMSHRSEIEKERHRSAEMEEALKEFRKFYGRTPLVDDWELAREMYCIMWINCFSVSGKYSMTRGHESTLGLGFYLNTSRFNHSCRPDLLVDFEGARLVVQYPSRAVTGAEIESERSSLSTALNERTISYGFSSHFAGDAFFPLRHQRRGSLRFGYYFECQCVLCGDEKEAEMEEDAAVVVCYECSAPYVWTKTARQSAIKFWKSGTTKIGCRKSCACSTSQQEEAEVKTFKRRLQAGKNLKELEKQWLEAMEGRIRSKYANDIADECEAVMKEALKFWHPTENLRLAQLAERIFIANNVIVQSAVKREIPVDKYALRSAMEMGQRMVDYCSQRPLNTYNTAMAAYAYDLARLFEVAARSSKSSKESSKKWNRAADWYSYAALVWKTYGDKCADFVAALADLAEKALDAAAECHGQGMEDVAARKKPEMAKSEE